jgi:hypothetical protein
MAPDTSFLEGSFVRVRVANSLDLNERLMHTFQGRRVQDSIA